MTSRPQSRADFQIAIVCTLDIEKQAIDVLFDQEHEAADYRKGFGDPNHYKLGRIGRNHIVLVKLSSKGSDSSSSSVTHLERSFPGIKVYILVGICGGVPFQGEPGNETETIMGDVVISDSIIRTDLGKQYENEYSRRTDRREILGNPPLEIRNIISGLHSEPQRLQCRMIANLREIQRKSPGKWHYGSISDDRLFATSFRHRHYGPSITCECVHCNTKDDPTCRAALRDSCIATGCLKIPDVLISRRRLRDAEENSEIPTPMVHFGTIASANTVMKSATHRDQIIELERKRGEYIVAFEMEGAGMWDDRPCVIIKGVSDYADSHKNDTWHPYAAATSAACAKAFIEEWIPSDTIPSFPPPYTSRSHQDLSSRFRGQESNISSSSTSIVSTNGRAFYNLTRDHLKQDVEGYWDRLTIEAWRIYRSIYRTCCDKRTKRVYFSEFIGQFDLALGPPHAVIHSYWMKVMLPENRQAGTMFPLSQGSTLAVLYMLHIYHVMCEEPPSVLSDKRLYSLKLFADWTYCCCPLECGRAWNFVSRKGIWKLVADRRPVDADPHCQGRCFVDMYLNHNFRGVEYISAYEETWRIWWNAHWDRHRFSLDS